MLKVTVSSCTAEGRSTLAAYIARCLVGVGFEVEVTDDCPEDGPTSAAGLAKCPAGTGAVMGLYERLGALARKARDKGAAIPVGTAHQKRTPERVTMELPRADGEKQECGNCRNWYAIPEREGKGICRRWPPEAGDDAVIDRDWWCGEHTPSTPPASDGQMISVDEVLELLRARLRQPDAVKTA